MKKALTRKLSILLAAVLCVSLFAACGSGSGTQEASQTAKSSSTSAASAASAAEKSEAAPAAADGVTLTYADFNTAACNTGVGADTLAEKVLNESNGAVKVDTYHDSQLGSVTEGLSMLETGVCDIVWTTHSFFSGQFPASETLSIPGLGVEDNVEATEAVWQLYEQYPEAFEKEYEGYHVLAAYCNAAYLLGTDRVITSADEIKGLSLYSQAGMNSVAVMSWGANPVSLAPPDMYTSMQKGVINGFLFNASGMQSYNMGELTKGLYDIGMGYVTILVLMTEDKWNSLTPEQQGYLDSVYGKEGSLYWAGLIKEEAEESINSMVESGVDYHKYAEGDELYDALNEKTSSSTALSDWEKQFDGSDIDPQKLVDIVTEYVANN